MLHFHLIYLQTIEDLEQVPNYTASDVYMALIEKARRHLLRMYYPYGIG